MTDFAQVYQVRVDGVDPNGGNINISFQFVMQHAGVVQQVGSGVTFPASGGIAGMETAIGNQVRALFLAQYGVALGANLIVIESHKLI